MQIPGVKSMLQGNDQVEGLFADPKQQTIADPKQQTIAGHPHGQSFLNVAHNSPKSTGKNAQSRYDSPSGYGSLQRKNGLLLATPSPLYENKGRKNYLSYDRYGYPSDSGSYGPRKLPFRPDTDPTTNPNWYKPRQLNRWNEKGYDNSYNNPYLGYFDREEPSYPYHNQQSELEPKSKYELTEKSLDNNKDENVKDTHLSAGNQSVVPPLSSCCIFCIRRVIFCMSSVLVLY